jgi:hypothetical protein
MDNDTHITISWTRPMLTRFKAAYKAATTDTFTFDGHEFVRGYAKYLIEYLEGNLPGGGCSHERLNEDGYCRRCGADCRGIH